MYEIIFEPIPGYIGVMQDANRPSDIWAVEDGKLEEAKAEAARINAEEGTAFVFIPFDRQEG